MNTGLGGGAEAATVGNDGSRSGFVAAVLARWNSFSPDDRYARPSHVRLEARRQNGQPALENGQASPTFLLPGWYVSCSTCGSPMPSLYRSQWPVVVTSGMPDERERTPYRSGCAVIVPEGLRNLASPCPAGRS